MDNEAIQRNTRWVQTFDRIIGTLNLDTERPVNIFRIADGREVIVVQPNAFTISRIYATGRPDGMRPHGMESYYDYFFQKVRDYEEENGTRDGFELEPAEWDTLFEESFHRYTRYLLFAGIKRWKDVQRDTATNLEVTNLARQCAPAETAWRSYQYKGYMLMMHSIASAELSLQVDDTAAAVQHIDTGIQRIGEFCGECLREEHGEAENITRERYLSNLIEFRSDLEALENDAADTESDEEDILAELERLLNDDET